MFQFGARSKGRKDRAGCGPATAQGQRELENPLAPGRYFAHCGVRQDQGKGEVDLFVQGAVDFVVFGGERSGGVLALEHEIEAQVEPGGGR